MWLFFSCLGNESHIQMTEQIETLQEQPEVYVSQNRWRAKAKHILIAHSNAKISNKDLKRSEQEAYRRASDILDQLKKGSSFEELALQFSDDPNRNQGGVLDAFGRGEMEEVFESEVFRMKIHETKIIESAFGIHVVQRLPLEEYRLRSLVIQYVGGRESTETRSREEARNLIYSLRERIEAGENISTLVEKYSDGPFGPWGGGIGYVDKEYISDVFRKQLSELEEGDISPILESSYGFHLFEKLPYLEEEISIPSPQESTDHLME